MSVTTCPYCNKTYTIMKQVQQTLAPPPPTMEPTDLCWEDSETRSGRHCERAYLRNNSRFGYPTQVYINLKRIIEIHQENNSDGKAVFNDYFYWIGKDHIGRMETDYY